MKSVSFSEALPESSSKPNLFKIVVLYYLSGAISTGGKIGNVSTGLNEDSRRM